jgi:hypothetical protein
LKRVGLILLAALYSSLSAQTISFDIRVFASTDGRMDVVHKQEADGTELYTMVSNSRIKVLWITKNYCSKFEARYKNGKLISCSHLETESDKVKRWAKVTYDGKMYQVDSDKGKRSFSDQPVHSDLSMYFEDCRKITSVFYLADADFDAITHTGESTMEFKSGDGHRNVYFLENGRIKQMEFHLALATVYMSRID